MPNSISWVDDIGAASLSNGKAGPGSRFSDWVVNKKPFGPSATAPGTGDVHTFEFRLDLTASFSVNAIPESSFDLLIRLQFHLLAGGSVEIDSDREMADAFATAYLAPEAGVEIQQTDPVTREYTLTTVVRAAA